jgi:hypothetical protein
MKTYCLVFIKVKSPSIFEFREDAYQLLLVVLEISYGGDQ